MDKLEEHIRKNREDLDRYSPSSGIWKRIKKGLLRNNSSLTRLISVAAMITVILGTAAVLFRPGQWLSDRGADSKRNGMLMQVSSQLKETEIYYNSLANSLYREATPLLTHNPEIEKELLTDISQIDSICSEIKKDLKDNVANEDVIEALIQNYRIKIRLLEDMLSILKENEANPEKNNSHEL